MPLPTARRPMPRAAVVLPFPGPVWIRSIPRREAVIDRGTSDQGKQHRTAERTDASAFWNQSSSISRSQGFGPFFPAFSVACVIWMSSQNCTSSIELFSQHQARQRMRHGEWTQRKQQLCATPCLIAPSARRSNRKQHLLCSLVAPLPYPGRERLRRHLPPAAIQKNRHRRRSSLLAIEPRKQVFLGPERHRLALYKGRHSFEIELTQSMEFIASGDARTDMRQEDLHAKQNTSPDRDPEFCIFPPYYPVCHICGEFYRSILDPVTCEFCNTSVPTSLQPRLATVMHSQISAPSSSSFLLNSPERSPRVRYLVLAFEILNGCLRVGQFGFILAFEFALRFCVRSTDKHTERVFPPSP